MTTAYPGSIDSFRSRENVPGQVYDPLKPTRLYAEDLEEWDDAIVSIEETLGENPQGDYDSVKDWLQWLTDNGGGGGISNLDGGTAFSFYSALDPIDGGSA